MEDSRIHENPRIEKSYFSYVKAQARRNPSLSNLVDFLSLYRRPGWPAKKACRILSLEFHENTLRPETQPISLENLHFWLRQAGTEHDDSVGEDGESRGKSLLGRLLIIEDLSPALIEELGSFLDIDPLFFASHLHAPSFDTGTQLPDAATLPSRNKPQRFANIHYHRTIVFDQDHIPSGTLIRDTNIPRKVAVLPRIKNSRIGLAQQCTSIYKAERPGIFWIGVILVDPPITANFTLMSKTPARRHSLTLSSELFLKGYEDFLDPPSFHSTTDEFLGPNRIALFDDLNYYWSAATPPGFDTKDPYLLTLAYFALKIVAGEWVKYVAVMSSCIKEYEYSKREKINFLQELEKLDTDLQALQSWRRRTMSTKQKLLAVLRLLQSYETTKMPVAVLTSLREDFKHIEHNVSDCGARLESMLPTVTSLVQIVDSRRSFAETANVSRLTVLALVFVPLSFVASLFSMNQELGPGGVHFWIYFAVAIPVTMVVILLARPPWQTIRRFLKSLRRRDRVTTDELGGQT